MDHALVCAPNSMRGFAEAHAYANLLPAASDAAFCMSCRLVIVGRACLYIVGISYRELMFLGRCRGEKKRSTTSRGGVFESRDGKVVHQLGLSVTINEGPYSVN